MLVPTTARTGTAYSASACSTPMCASPRAPPPPSASTRPGFTALASPAMALRHQQHGAAVVFEQLRNQLLVRPRLTAREDERPGRLRAHRARKARRIRADAPETQLRPRRRAIRRLLLQTLRLLRIGRRNQHDQSAVRFLRKIPRQIERARRPPP